MKRIIKATAVFLLAAFLTAGCTKKNMKKAHGELIEITTQDSPISIDAQEDNRVLSYAGTPNEKGFYSIDMPRSSEDLYSLEQINDRLHFVSAMMAKTGTKELGANMNGELYWQTMKQEAAFTIGDMAVLSSGGKSKATISKEDFSKLSELCFGVKPNFENVASCFTNEKSSLSFDLNTSLSGAYGFVIKEYKKEGKKWFIRGDIMSSGEKVFASGVFTLEENGSEDIISHRILEFKEE